MYLLGSANFQRAFPSVEGSQMSATLLTKDVISAAAKVGYKYYHKMLPKSTWEVI